jgi:ElaB/YqjD/DUF883 family membrane-anchored ribosome-binding protein
MDEWPDDVPTLGEIARYHYERTKSLIASAEDDFQDGDLSLSDLQAIRDHISRRLSEIRAWFDEHGDESLEEMSRREIEIMNQKVERKERLEVRRRVVDRLLDQWALGEDSGARTEEESRPAGATPDQLDDLSDGAKDVLRAVNDYIGDRPPAAHPTTLAELFRGVVQERPEENAKNLRERLRGSMRRSGIPWPDGSSEEKVEAIVKLSAALSQR